MRYFSEKQGALLDQLAACPECDLLMPKVIPAIGQKTECPRCNCVLSRHKQHSVSRSLALGLTGLFLYIPAIFLPLMTFRKLGLSDSSNIFETITGFYGSGYYLVALIVFFSAVLFPLLKLSLLVVVTTCIQLGIFVKVLPRLFRLHNHLESWAMMEVYLLGIVVTIVKMYHSTTITFDTGFYFFVGLVVVTLAGSVTVSKDRFWNRIEELSKPVDQITVAENQLEPAHFSAISAIGSGLILCKECRKLLYRPIRSDTGRGSCPRCHATLHQRKSASIARTWALIVTAAILFIPANMLPIMQVEFLGIPKNSTILDGIRIFFEDGSYGVAVIILLASILIPLFKIIGISIALLTICFNRPNHLRQKTVMFRIIEFVGRWSMLDIFVIAILGVFVNFGFLTTITTAPAATYFCLVVVITMMAAMTFDPRIMWDLLSRDTPSSGKHQ